jgi:hypothetical protein
MLCPHPQKNFKLYLFLFYSLFHIVQSLWYLGLFKSVHIPVCISGYFKNVLSVHKHCVRYNVHFAAFHSADTSDALDVWTAVVALV